VHALVPLLILLTQMLTYWLHRRMRRRRHRTLELRQEGQAERLGPTVSEAAAKHHSCRNTHASPSTRRTNAVFVEACDC